MSNVQLAENFLSETIIPKWAKVIAVYHNDIAYFGEHYEQTKDYKKDRAEFFLISELNTRRR